MLVEKLYKTRKAKWRGRSSHHRFIQNFTIFPFLTLNWMFLLKVFQSIRILFYKPHPWTPFPSLEVHHPPPPPGAPFLPKFQNYHPSPKLVSSTPKCLNHFSSKVLLKVVSFLIPKPPLPIGIHTLSHPNKCVLEALHKKSFCIFSVLLATLIRMVKRDKKESREARQCTLKQS